MPNKLIPKLNQTVGYGFQEHANTAGPISKGVKQPCLQAKKHLAKPSLPIMASWYGATIALLNIDHKIRG